MQEKSRFLSQTTLKFSLFKQIHRKKGDSKDEED
jgi:hypothetical protein